MECDEYHEYVESARKGQSTFDESVYVGILLDKVFWHIVECQECQEWHRELNRMPEHTSH